MLGAGSGRRGGGDLVGREVEREVGGRGLGRGPVVVPFSGGSSLFLVGFFVVFWFFSVFLFSGSKESAEATLGSNEWA